MLDAMQRRGLDYASALADAQRLGYAEADPTADVSGLDALRKIMLGCAVGFGLLPVEGLDCEGIESFSAADAADLKKRGLCCRLLARGGKSASGVYAYVEPMALGASAAECSVLDNFNMARYRGVNSGDIIMIGQGAGRWPTASAVLRDLSCILRGERAMLGAGCVSGKADMPAVCPSKKPGGTAATPELSRSRSASRTCMRLRRSSGAAAPVYSLPRWRTEI